jgi:error-prone DNA polymerase
MGYNNPPIPWSELERRLSDRHRPGGPPLDADGGDSPAWSRARQPYDPDPWGHVRPPDGPVVPYAELHCHSFYSFLDGAASPEELVEESVRLGLNALALTDHDGFYGVVRMAEAAEAYDGLDTVFGAELSLGLTMPQNGVADPEGSHLMVLARGQQGYHALAGAITEAQLRGGEKGKPSYDLEELAAGSADWFVLTGCRKGLVRQALERGGPATGRDDAAAELSRLVALFGAERVAVELFDHGYPLDSTYNDVLAGLAAEAGLPVVATNNVHYAIPYRRRLASAVAAVRARRSLAEMDGWLPASGAAHLRSGEEMAARFRRYDGAVPNTVRIAADLAFNLRKAKPRLPKLTVPDEYDDLMDWLSAECRKGARRMYEGRPHAAQAYWRLERELEVIGDLDFPGYFLIVHEIVEFARSQGILCQGRGSAASSVVCYALGITAVDPVKYDLPFERFLSATREEEPDIDVDFDSDRREEVIQHVYERYGRRNAAQVANVITYRPKLAVRDMAKALGHSTGQQDAWSKQVDAWGAAVSTADHDIPGPVVQLAEELLKFPRHLGIHSGGMVLTDIPVGTVVPIEHARMENRTVLQWDKDDCAWMGLVKFDLLGLGMLAALQYTMDTVATELDEKWELRTIPQEEPGVYDQLCRADSIGVFQVESRAQMGTLPRLRPRRFYDLAIEVALIRPGPIQGGAVHPFVRRKLGEEPVTYLHPSLEPVLERTKGVPLFQEQLMQIAMTVGGCSGDDADLLRRAMGSKRGVEKISSLKQKLYDGMATNGITGDLADEIYLKIEAFANFGFAESHSISFALLVYASTWLRLHYPAAFLAALLRAQPMGFYSPQSLVADARRHGVEVRRPDLHLSDAHPVLEPVAPSNVTPTGDPACLELEQPPVPEKFDPDAPFDTDDHRRDGAFAVRLGLAGVKSIGTTLAEQIVAEREKNGPYADQADLVRRTGLGVVQVEALATAGAFECFGLSRRQALWEAGRAAEVRPGHLTGVTSAGPPPTLPGMSDVELTMADLWATGISPEDHPVRHVREQLEAAGVLSAEQLRTAEDGRRVRAAGVVTHRQRPATAGGVTFVNLEDETGMINVVCSEGVWNRYRRVARESGAMIVRGRVERAQGVTNLVADRIERLPLAARTTSRDFR